MTITTVACPQCRRHTSWAGNPHRPFCSERCRAIDLGQWAAEEYRIPLPATDNTTLYPVAGDDKE